MKYVCDAPGGSTWFRLETELEAVKESQLMNHAVEKYFRQEEAKASASFRPASQRFIEQEIGRKAHIQRAMPWFLTLRENDGTPRATAMLPPGGKDDHGFRIIIVGAGNADPYPEYGEAIESLAKHLGLELDRARCYPYQRGG